MTKLAPLYQVNIMQSELGYGMALLETVYFDDAIDAKLFAREFNDENYNNVGCYDSTFLAEVAGRVI